MNAPGPDEPPCPMVWFADVREPMITGRGDVVLPGGVDAPPPDAQPLREHHEAHQLRAPHPWARDPWPVRLAWALVGWRDGLVCPACIGLRFGPRHLLLRYAMGACPSWDG